MAETAEKIADDAPSGERAGTAVPVTGDDGSTTPAPVVGAVNGVANGAAVETAQPAPQSDAPKSSAEESTGEQPGQLTCTATLRNRYLIDGARPLPQFDSPTAHAYAVTDEEGMETRKFALVCAPGMPVRAGAIRKLRLTRHKGLLPIIDWGYVFWEPAERVVAVIVFEQPLGGSLVDAIATGATRIGEYDVVKRVILPAMIGISSLEESGLVHRAIRPDNMYFMDEDRNEIVLGECVTSPPGYDQPEMYESIERSMTPPAGRGEGYSADDIYALGISIVMILLGYNPLKKYSAADILSTKIEKGTYAAVCGSARLPMSVIEVLRGLMSDDEEARWGAEQTDAWANGRKQTPLQRQGQQKATSPYTFKNQGHVTLRTLAFAFANDYEEAYRTLKADQNLEGWIRRSIQDEDIADIYKALMEHAVSMADTPAAKPDMVISRICMLLDPAGPIRYRGYALMPDALGAAVAIEIMLKNNPKPISDIIEKEVFEFWFKAQDSLTNDDINWQRLFVKCRGYLKTRAIGYGIERVLYEMNEAIPCQSGLVIQENVSDCTELLVALDKIAGKIETGTRPMDRHMAAFIAARFPHNLQHYLLAIAAPVKERAAIGILSLFAYIQLKTESGPLLGLASWLGGQAGPSINAYHSRTTRRELERAIPQLVRKGSLTDLFELLENEEKHRIDAEGFEKAQDEFLAAENEVIDTIGTEGERDKKLLQSGQKAAALISVTLSMCIMTMIFVLEVF